LRIGNLNNKVCVLGIDASFRGLLRRLGVPDGFFPSIFQAKLIDWREAQFIGNSQALQLNTAVENLSELHPADLANIVEDLGVKQGSSLLASLDAGDAAKVLEEVDPEIQTILVQSLGPDRAGKILSQMSSDEFADLIKTLSVPEARELLSKVGAARAQSVEKLAIYDDNSAGGLMTLDFVAVRPTWTVEQTIEEIKKLSRQMRSIVYVYVTDEQGKFVGGVSMRRLLLAEKEAIIKKLAKDFPPHSILKPDDELEKIIRVMTKYNLYSSAVLDIDHKLVGVVTIDDVMRTLAPSA
jgi:Mg/Co/Ni transporter MgtE